MKKVAFYTLGCKLNFAETSTISRFFDKVRFQTVKFSEVADYYVINSCTVTANSNKKSRNAINRAIRLNPNAVVIVTGCYVQTHFKDIENIKGVNFIFGGNDKNKIAEIIENDNLSGESFKTVSHYKDMQEFFHAYSIGDRTRSFLKVQDGCDYFCAYCTIPYARGKSRNPKITELLKNAQDIANSGIKEIILTGVNIGDFGKTTNETFFDLLNKIKEIDKIKRIRIGSIEPNLLEDRVIDLIANSDNLMPHFHIPLQSGSDAMLKLIGRKYDTKLFKDKISKIKKLIPDAFIGVDLIVGINGETDDYFNQTVEFLEKLDISYIHHFQYSEREKTRAVNFTPKLSSEKKQARVKTITAITKSKFNNYLKSFIGTKRKVLFEAIKKQNKIFGYTDNYIRVCANFDKNLINNIVEVEIIDFYDDSTLEVKIIANET